MNIAIVDDEKHCIESLSMHLKELYPLSNIIYQTGRPEEALQMLPEKQPDLLFLDVEMPGLNGFELLEQLDEYPFDVIFTTAYSKYAVKAFQYRAFSYLLKPVDEDELREIVELWKEKKKKDVRLTSREEIGALLNDLKNQGALKNKIAVPVSDGFEFVELDSITYCQSDNNYTRIFLNSGDDLLISKTLKSVDQSLSKHGFLRIHQSWLISPNYLKSYHRQDGGYVLMQDGQRIPVSTRKKELIHGLFEAIHKQE
jgi:two-component system, LytTR family, response regulator